MVKPIILEGDDMHTVSLGDRAKDRVSGFVGIVIGRTEWLNGCTTVGLKPPIDKDGKNQDAQWFDEPQLELIEQGVIARGSVLTGGPKPTPQRFVSP